MVGDYGPHARSSTNPEGGRVVGRDGRGVSSRLNTDDRTYASQPRLDPLPAGSRYHRAAAVEYFSHRCFPNPVLAPSTPPHPQSAIIQQVPHFDKPPIKEALIVSLDS